MERSERNKELRLDRPLRAGTALDADALDRRAFASRVTEVLRRITSDEGLVVSVEGPWGSGKTSVLAMVEELLKSELEDERPLVVHFNPWLIGDREALLRQFLASIAKAVRLTDHAKEGKRVAKELKTYSKAFDVLKLIPGAEPWASIVKSVVESVGDATGAAAEHKTPDVEARKDALEKALRKFPQRIVVLLDDLDRLYPAEAFEMVRIVKAVGDFPNVGYVLAWDEKYVSAALERLNVPFAGSYLDKVVQVRLPIPPLSFRQRMALMNQGLQRLPPEALVAHFPNGDDRLASLFHAGQRELVEQPRDVVRLFDVVAAIEPGLRGEVHLADMLGLATLMTKAPAVYDLLCRTPQAFVGRRPGATASFDKPLEVIQSFANERNKAIDSYPYAKGVRDVVHWLFPQTAKADDAFTLDRVVFWEGHLAHPERLQVALHLSARPGDLSLVRVRQYLFEPAKRGEIAATLQQDNCIDFIEQLGNMAEGLATEVGVDAASLAKDIARLVDTQPFVRRASERHDAFVLRADRAAERAIGQLAKRLDEAEAGALAEHILCDRRSLSMAAALAATSFMAEDGESEGALKAPADARDRALSAYASNVEESAKSGELFTMVSPGYALWVLTRLVPQRCKAVFLAVQHWEPSLDTFVEAMLRHSFDSNNGQKYRLPRERELLENFVALEDLKKLALERLKDEAMTYPLRAAWRAIVEENSIYGKDGTLARR